MCLIPPHTIHFLGNILFPIKCFYFPLSVVGWGGKQCCLSRNRGLVLGASVTTLEGPWSEHSPETCSARRGQRHCSPSHSHQLLSSGGELTAEVKSCYGWLRLYSVSVFPLWEGEHCPHPHRWFQQVPAGSSEPTAGPTVEPLNPASDASGKMYFKKGQKCDMII